MWALCVGKLGQKQLKTERPFGYVRAHEICFALTRVERIFDTEHRGSVAILHVLLDHLLGHVHAAVAHADAGAQVVEVAAVQLEELDEQHAEVSVQLQRALSLVPRMQLQHTAQYCLKHETLRLQ